MNQFVTVETIRAKVASDPKWTERSILAIYARQTPDEQAVGDTTKNNGRGFSGTDGKFMSSLAKWIQSSRKPDGSRLTPKQLLVAQKVMPKYAKQLHTIMLEKAQAAPDANQPVPNIGVVDDVQPDRAQEAAAFIGDPEFQDPAVTDASKDKKSWTIETDTGPVVVDFDPSLEENQDRLDDLYQSSSECYR